MYFMPLCSVDLAVMRYVSYDAITRELGNRNSQDKAGEKFPVNYFLNTQVLVKGMIKKYRVDFSIIQSI